MVPDLRGFICSLLAEQIHYSPLVDDLLDWQRPSFVVLWGIRTFARQHGTIMTLLL